MHTLEYKRNLYTLFKKEKKKTCTEYWENKTKNIRCTAKITVFNNLITSDIILAGRLTTLPAWTKRSPLSVGLRSGL